MFLYCKVSCLFSNRMGSDLGHESEDVFQFFTSEEWSRGEKQFLRLILSHRYGSILIGLILEFIFYHYAVCV